MEVISEARPTHQHHWTIAEANGPISGGVCKLCNAHRDFANWLSTTDFIGGDERSGSASNSNSGYGSGPRAGSTYDRRNSSARSW